MPTCYTAKLVNNGQSFNEFVLQCARAMGALIMMRDDPMDAPIPEAFEPSDFYTKSVKEAKERLKLLDSMTNEQKIAEGERLLTEYVKQHEKWLAKDLGENKRLEAMERQVLAWVPPSSEHDAFKDFMLDQLRISKHDLAYARNRIATAKLSSQMEFFAKSYAEAERNITYGEEELAKEIERTAGRNVWIKQLRESLTTTGTKATTK